LSEISPVGSNYLYTFNGKETENEIGNGDLDFGARIYNARVGRWMSIDPLCGKHPNLSPYIFSENNLKASLKTVALENRNKCLTLNRENHEKVKVQ
jgi:RHS repeat-associated protein